MLHLATSLNFKIWNQKNPKVNDRFAFLFWFLQLGNVDRLRMRLFSYSKAFLDIAILFLYAVLFIPLIMLVRYINVQSGSVRFYLSMHKEILYNEF